MSYSAVLKAKAWYLCQLWLFVYG